MNFVYRKSANLTLAKALSLEWLETNGLGGYASSTIINCHTRKYHGLLVARLENLPDKYVLLSKIEDILQLDDGQQHFLTAHQYPNYLEDGSFNNFQEFILDTYPHFRYKFANTILEKEILLVDGENTILIKYKIAPKTRAKLKIRPFLAFRNFHALAHENSGVQFKFHACQNGWQFSPYQNMPSLFLQTNINGVFTQENLWYRNFIYEQERERGYEFSEDLFAPGVVDLSFPASGEIIIACSICEQKHNLAKTWNSEIKRRINFENSLTGSSLQKQLKKVAKSFIVKRNANSSAVTAGYHWFLEWGRDAMIALPGLTLYSGLEKVCLAVFREYASHEHQGLIPNFLGTDGQKAAYNSVDASLWFAWAIQQYYFKTKNIKSIARYLWSTLKNIFYSYKNGTLYNIKMQDNGLLYAGSSEVNLTWMDAMVNNQPVTPRYGLSVEINALWFNTLSFMRMLAEIMLDPIKYEIEPLITKFQTAFVATFWNPKLGYLYDFVNEEQKNISIRPNQIFAISLPYSPLKKLQAFKVMTVVTDHLLTPCGLRTLSPKDPNYCGDYQGDQEARDKAYHNGTIWPWLLCHFAEGLLAVGNDKKYVISLLQPCIKSLKFHLRETGIGTIAEVFSANAPHGANGCISQAWSVAEVLRLICLLNLM